MNNEKENNGWISVKEFLPPNNKTVMVFIDISEKVYSACLDISTPNEERGWYIYNEQGSSRYFDDSQFITHWQPLPLPPEN